MKDIPLGAQNSNTQNAKLSRPCFCKSGSNRCQIDVQMVENVVDRVLDSVIEQRPLPGSDRIDQWPRVTGVAQREIAARPMVAGDQRR